MIITHNEIMNVFNELIVSEETVLKTFKELSCGQYQFVHKNTVWIFFLSLGEFLFLCGITSNDCIFGCSIICKDNIHNDILLIDPSTMLDTTTVIH